MKEQIKNELNMKFDDFESKKFRWINLRRLLEETRWRWVERENFGWKVGEGNRWIREAKGLNWKGKEGFRKPTVDFKGKGGEVREDQTRAQGGNR